MFVCQRGMGSSTRSATGQTMGSFFPIEMERRMLILTFVLLAAITAFTHAAPESRASDLASYSFTKSENDTATPTPTATPEPEEEDEEESSPLDLDRFVLCGRVFEMAVASRSFCGDCNQAAAILYGSRGDTGKHLEKVLRFDKE